MLDLVTEMSRYPFPHTRKLEHLCYPSAATPADALRAFEAWQSEIVTAEGARGFLRTRRPDTPDGVANSTVSEGIAYGMIIAVLCDQQALFDDLYRYALCFENKSGLMDWYIAPDGSRPLAQGAATDSDEDIAWALLMADRQWGGQGALAEPYLVHASARSSAFGSVKSTTIAIRTCSCQAMIGAAKMSSIHRISRLISIGSSPK